MNKKEINKVHAKFLHEVIIHCNNDDEFQATVGAHIMTLFKLLKDVYGEDSDKLFIFILKVLVDDDIINGEYVIKND